MKTLLSFVSGLLIALALAGAAGAADQASNAKTGWTNVPSKAASAKVKRDLQTLIGPTATWEHQSSTYEWGFWTSTIPQSTGIAGLCFRDELMLDYAVTVPNDDVGPQPAQPIGLTARRTYHVIDGPVADWGKSSVGDRRLWMAECRKLQSDDSADWFPERRAIEAVKAANLVRVAVAELQAGRLQPERCSIASYPDPCKAIILQGAKGLRIVGVRHDCSSELEQECYAVDLDGSGSLIELTIVAAFDEDTAVPKQIVSISADNPGFELGAWDGIHVDPEPRSKSKILEHDSAVR
jgi:hypothetical protein